MAPCPLVKWHILFCAAEIGTKIAWERELGPGTGYSGGSAARALRTELRREVRTEGEVGGVV
jgi:hypothetical protein